jgi:hypothetical protein
MRRLVILVLMIGLSTLSVESGQAEAPCATGATCNAEAKAALESHHLEAALRAWWQQVNFATGENDKALICNGFDQLARLSLQLGKPLRANAWAQTGAERCGNDQALANLAKEIAEALPVQDDDQTGGLYWSYAGYGAWSVIVVDQGNGLFAVQWIVKRYGQVRSADVGPAAIWDFEGNGRLEGDHFLIPYNAGDNIQCVVDFLKSPHSLVLQKELPNECLIGGAGTRLYGTFRRVEAN